MCRGEGAGGATRKSPEIRYSGGKKPGMMHAALCRDAARAASLATDERLRGRRSWFR